MGREGTDDAQDGDRPRLDRPDLAEELEDGSLDPDEVPTWTEPFDEGADDET